MYTLAGNISMRRSFCKVTLERLTCSFCLSHGAVACSVGNSLLNEVKIIVCWHQSCALDFSCTCCCCPFVTTQCACPFVLFLQLANVLSSEMLFYACIVPFIMFFASFAFVLYPLRDILHPTGEESATFLISASSL